MQRQVPRLQGRLPTRRSPRALRLGEAATLATGLVLLVGAGCEKTISGPGVPWGHSFIELTSPTEISDTINARLSDPIVGRLVNDAGGGLTGWTVEFRNQDLGFRRPSVAFRERANGPAESPLTVAADTLGVFRAWVTAAGTVGRVTVQLHAQGAATVYNVFVDVLPGAPTDLIFTPAPNTSLTVADTVSFDVVAVDRLQNAVSPDVQLSVVGPAHFVDTRLVIDDAGMVEVTGAFQGVGATAEYALVPRGRLAFGMEQTHVSSLEFDGDEFETLNGIGLNQGIALAPTGRTTVVSNGRLQVTDFSSLDRVTGPAGDTLFRYERSPRFAPNGTAIYFSGVSHDGHGSIWRTSIDGQDMTRVTPARAPGEVDRYPDPSHDGTRLLYTDTADGESFGTLTLFDLGTATPTPLGVEGHGGRWSPDDQWIAYVSPTGELRRVRPDGSEDDAVTTGWQFRKYFGWGPDGRYLLAASVDEELRLIRFTDGEVISVPAPYLFRGADWYAQPD